MDVLGQVVEFKRSNGLGLAGSGERIHDNAGGGGDALRTVCDWGVFGGQEPGPGGRGGLAVLCKAGAASGCRGCGGAVAL